MARKQQLSGTKKFMIIALSLIAIEAAYLVFFSRGTKPVTIREAILKTADQHTELPDQRRELLKIQLALADYRSKNNKYPDDLGVLIPEYFDSIPIDPANNKPFKYQINEGRYLLGDEELRKAGPRLAQGDGSGKVDAAVIASLENGETEVVSFVYNPAGKRDPFTPFDFSGAGKEIDPSNPLTGYDYGQLRLTSVLEGFDEPIAIVENSVGRGYTVRKGTKVGHNGGEVVEIQKDKVLILEQTTDFTGVKKKQTIELNMRVNKDGQKK